MWTAAAFWVAVFGMWMLLGAVAGALQVMLEPDAGGRFDADEWMDIMALGALPFSAAAATLFTVLFLALGIL